MIKHKKIKIVLLVLAALIVLPVGRYYAIGPRFYTDDISNEKRLYYKFNTYYSLYGVNDKSCLEEKGVSLDKKINCGGEPIYIAEDANGNEVIVCYYYDNFVVFLRCGD